MAKGLRLKFLGIECSGAQIHAMSAALGYNTCPEYESSWGTGGFRNFLGLCKHGNLYEVCASLVNNGLMRATIPPKFAGDEILFHVTDLGQQWFRLFRRHHKHPRF